MPYPSDASLFAALREGDEQAMAALYGRYSGVVYGIAMRVLRDTSAAEDVLQDTFLWLWRNPQAFDERRGNLGAWLAVIARHRAIDVVRKRRPETDLPETVPLDTNLEDRTARKVFVDKVRIALAAVPAEQRSALEMAFFEGMTHQEIAAKTGDPLGTVKTRIRLAIIAVRRVLAR